MGREISTIYSGKQNPEKRLKMLIRIYLTPVNLLGPKISTD